MQDITDITAYNKKDIATPFLVNDILEDQTVNYQRNMNCSTPPSPPSPSLLYSGYPRPGVPPTTSMTSFSPATAPAAYSHMHHTMSQLPSYGAGCYQGSDLSHYGDMRSTAAPGWYSSPATDPRFASEYFSSLMRGPTTGMGGMSSQMSGLTGCSMDGKQHIQFPLSQRRKRRVLFTQAQVRGMSLSLSAVCYILIDKRSVGLRRIFSATPLSCGVAT